MTVNKISNTLKLNTAKPYTAKSYTVCKALPIIATLLLLSACDSNSISPSNETVNRTSNDSTSQTNNAQTDTVNAPANQIKTMTKFPTHIKELSLLLHPLRPIKDANTNQGMLSSYKDKKGGYQPIFEEVTNLEYTSHVSNIIFEQTDTGITQKLLPHNNFIINNVFVPHVITYKRVQSKTFENDNTIDEANIMNPEILLEHELVNQINTSNTPTAKLFKKVITKTFDNIIYKVSETPYDKEEKDRNLVHQQALYMSDTSGKQLTKLHPDDEYLSTTEWMPSVSRYYFMTQSDSDKNGIIDGKDDYHNYVIDFKQDNPIAKKYDFSQ